MIARGDGRRVPGAVRIELGFPDARGLELRASLASRRLEALATLNGKGIETYAFVGPLLPHFRYDREGLDTTRPERPRLHAQVAVGRRLPTIQACTAAVPARNIAA